MQKCLVFLFLAIVFGSNSAQGMLLQDDSHGISQTTFHKLVKRIPNEVWVDVIIPCLRPQYKLVCRMVSKEWEKLIAESYLGRPILFKIKDYQTSMSFDEVVEGFQTFATSSFFQKHKKDSLISFYWYYPTSLSGSLVRRDSFYLTDIVEKVLCCLGNQVQEISLDLSCLVKEENACLSAEDINKLPKDLLTLSLRNSVLHGNTLSSLANKFQKLKTLRLCHISIQKIRWALFLRDRDLKNISELKKIEYLYLDKNKYITSQCLKHLPRGLKRLSLVGCDDMYDRFDRQQFVDDMVKIKPKTLVLSKGLRLALSEQDSGKFKQAGIKVYYC